GLQRLSMNAQAVQIDVAVQGLQFANATRSFGVSRRSVEALGVPINAESGFVVASATRALVVVRSTMEAVL
ncbi:hypothetical protein LU644_29680, partial [Pseudomonas alloputida]